MGQSIHSPDLFLPWGTRLGGQAGAHNTVVPTAAWRHCSWWQDPTSLTPTDYPSLAPPHRPFSPTSTEPSLVPPPKEPGMDLMHLHVSPAPKHLPPSSGVTQRHLSLHSPTPLGNLGERTGNLEFPRGQQGWRKIPRWWLQGSSLETQFNFTPGAFLCTILSIVYLFRSLVSLAQLTLFISLGLTYQLSTQYVWPDAWL